MFTLPKQPSTLEEIYALSFAFWWKTFTRVQPLVFACEFFVILPTLFFSLKHAGETQLTHNLFIFVPYSISFALLSLLAYATGFYRAYGYTDQALPLSWSACLKKALIRLIPLFIGAVLAGAIFAIGVFLFIIPGLYFLLAVSIMYALMLMDNLNPIKAITESLKLIQDHWWRTAIAIIPVCFSCLALTIFIQYYLFHIPEHIACFTCGPTPIQIIISTLIGTFFMPLYFSFLIIQTNDLKQRKAADKKINSSF